VAKFKIIQKDPTPYKQQILQMWEENLPGTPPGRFDWLNRGNPAGAAIWFFAFEEKTGELAGAISIMPKEVFLNGDKIRAGILGDLMVVPKYRVFGPVLQLAKTATKSLYEMGFRFIYTVPNPASKKIMERVGFMDIGVLQSMVRPTRVTYYLEKYVPPFLARVAAVFVEQGLRLLSRDTYIFPKGVFGEVSEFDESFDRLWDKKIKNNESGMIGDHSSLYLTWRYLRNPQYKFRILTYKKDQVEDLSSYIIFYIENDKLCIHDIFAFDKSCINAILKKIVDIARENKYHGVYIGILENNPLKTILKSFNFMDTKDNAFVSILGDYRLLGDKWFFFEGERNI